MANNHGGKRPGAGRPKNGMPKFGEWTSVDDLEPEDDTEYFVWAQQIDFSGTAYAWHITLAHWYDSGWSNPGYGAKINVTHFMPLPPPPA